jgi:hypothetical protein
MQIVILIDMAIPMLETPAEQVTVVLKQKKQVERCRSPHAHSARDGSSNATLNTQRMNDTHC